MNHLRLSLVLAAAPDKCPVCDVASPGIAGRGLHYGHWQGSSVGADLRPGESRDGHVSSHLLAAGQLQLPARRLRTVKPGIFRHTISGLSPNTIYRVTIKAKNIRSPHFNTMDETTAKYAEKYCTHVQFRTLPKGVPDPPVDVQVELGPQDGTLLVTWLPVAINSQSGKSNGVPVTGYPDGRKEFEKSELCGIAEEFQEYQD